MQMQSKPREDVVNESGDTEEEVGATVTDKAEIKYPKEDIVNKACDKEEDGVTAEEKANAEVEDEGGIERKRDEEESIPKRVLS
jgi:hypothetical protein